MAEGEGEGLGFLFPLVQAEKDLERATSDFHWEHTLELQKSKSKVEVARMTLEESRLEYQAARLKYDTAMVEFQELKMKDRNPRMEQAEGEYQRLLDEALPKAMALKDKFSNTPFRVISTAQDAIALRKLKDLTGFSCLIVIENVPDADSIRKKCDDLELDRKVLEIEELGDKSPNREAESSSHGYRISTGSYLERKDDY